MTTKQDPTGPAAVTNRVMVAGPLILGKLSCPCCGKGTITKELRTVLLQVAVRLGRNVNVNSAYRCPAHNAELTGAAMHSWHLKGMAADIWVDSVHPCDLARVCEEVLGECGGLGIYPDRGFVHVDVRPGKHRFGYLGPVKYQKPVSYETAMMARG